MATLERLTSALPSLFSRISLLSLKWIHSSELTLAHVRVAYYIWAGCIFGSDDIFAPLQRLLETFTFRHNVSSPPWLFPLLTLRSDPWWCSGQCVLLVSARRHWWPRLPLWVSDMLLRYSQWTCILLWSVWTGFPDPLTHYWFLSYMLLFWFYYFVFTFIVH